MCQDTDKQTCLCFLWVIWIQRFFFLFFSLRASLNAPSWPPPSFLLQLSVALLSVGLGIHCWFHNPYVLLGEPLTCTVSWDQYWLIIFPTRAFGVLQGVDSSVFPSVLMRHLHCGTLRWPLLYRILTVGLGVYGVFPLFQIPQPFPLLEIQALTLLNQPSNSRSSV